MKKEVELSPQEAEILEIYRKISPEARKDFREFLVKEVRAKVIREGLLLARKAPRGDLQGWVEAQCLMNPELDADEILKCIDEYYFHL